MKTFFICLIQLLVFANCSFSQGEYVNYFHRVYESEYDARLHAVTETPNGNYLVGGCKIYRYFIDSLYNDSTVAYFHETDNKGNILWETFFDVPGWDEEYCKAVTAKNGDIYFLINAYIGNWIPYIVKTDSLRNILWVKKIENESSITCYDIKVYDHGIVVGGVIDVYPFFIQHPFFIKINENGVQEYSYWFTAGGSIRSIFVNTDNEFILCGPGFFTKIVSDTINLIKHIGVGGNEFTRTDNHDIYVASDYNIPNQAIYPCITKMDKNGNIIWSKYYKSSWWGAQAFNITSLKNNVYLLIEPQHFQLNPSGYRVGLMKFDISGQLLTTNIFEWEKWSYPTDIMSTQECQLLLIYKSGPLSQDGTKFSMLKTDGNNDLICIDDTLIETEEINLNYNSFAITGYDTVNFLTDAQIFQLKDSVFSFLSCIDSVYYEPSACDTSKTIATEDFVLPNIITPNNDNINDGLLINTTSPVLFIVYNRWGTPIYSANSNHIYWSGIEPSGKRVSDGVYYYIIRDDLNAIIKKGFITVISN